MLHVQPNEIPLHVPRACKLKSAFPHPLRLLLVRIHKCPAGLWGYVSSWWGSHARPAAAQADRADSTGPVDVPLPLDKLAENWLAAGEQPVVLVSCGSFNPPTIMHLRMFDLATQALQEVRPKPLPLLLGLDCWPPAGCRLGGCGLP